MGGEWFSVAELQAAEVLIVEDGNHGESRPRREEFGSIGTAFVRAADMSNGSVVFERCEHINDVARARIRKGIGKPRDILLSHKGTVGKLAQVPADAPPFVCSPQTTFWRVIDTGRIHREYLYAFMQSRLFTDQLTAVQGETDMAPYVSLTAQRRLKIALPALHRQVAIGDSLGALDDKIELNRRMAETLEAMTRALFRSWFVDFDPVHARAEGRPTGIPDDLAALFPDSFGDDGLPNGWQHCSLYDFVDVIYGAPFASSRFNSEGIGLPLIRIRDLSNHNPSIFTDERHNASHVIDAGDIVVGMDGEFRCHLWHGPAAYLNQRLCHFEPLEEIPKSFVKLALEVPLALFERGAVGTTVIHLGKKDLDTVRFVFPGSHLLQAFGTISDPLLNRSVHASVQSRALAALRDTLLPKLISGELGIADAEQRVAAA